MKETNIFIIIFINENKKLTFTYQEEMYSNRIPTFK